MEIDDDDEDIIQVVIDVVNESSIPIGGLQAALVDSSGQRHEAAEGISSIEQLEHDQRPETEKHYAL